MPKSSLAHARKIIISNVWLLTDDQGHRFVVDTGYPLERPKLRRFLRRSGVEGAGDLAGVLLTHRHSDHAGNAAWMRETYHCPVICHENDAPFLTGERTPPKLQRGLGNAWDRFACTIEDTLPSVCPVDETFSEGSWRYGFSIYPAFGHTEGSVLLYHEPTKTLFSGDALLTGLPPFRSIEYLQLAVAAYTPELESCHAHVLRFLENPPDILRICSGHGPLVDRHASQKLLRFAEKARRVKSLQMNEEATVSLS